MVKVETEMDRALRYYKNEVHKVERPLQDRSITKEEYQELIGMYWEFDPFRIIWQILWETGMRPIEACWLQLDNLDLEKLEIGYKISKPGITFTYGQKVKTYKSRVVPISQDLTKRLKQYLVLNKDGFRFGYLFPAPSLQSRFLHLNPRCLNNELDKKRLKLGSRFLDLNSEGDHLIGPHSFRRSWITRYLNFSKNPAETARAIGHTSIEVTYGYYQNMTGDKLTAFNQTCV